MALNSKCVFGICWRLSRSLEIGTTFTKQRPLIKNTWSLDNMVGSPCASKMFTKGQVRSCSTESTESEEDMEESADLLKGRDVYEPIDAMASIQYMESDAYKETYGDLPVWYHYRPNHKFGRPKRITRDSCVKGGVVTTGNPCPICRDNYLTLDYRNVKLLKQFLTPNEVSIYEPVRTQICMKQNKQLLISLAKAKDVGYLEDKELGFRSYDYSHYYESVNEVKPQQSDEVEDDSFIRKVLQSDSQV